MDRKFEITDAKSGSSLSIRVVTRATQTEIAGISEEGVLKIRLVASPAGDPAANKELISFLSEKLDVPAEKFEIVAGEGGRDKLVTIVGLTVEDVQAKLGGVADSGDE